MENKLIATIRQPYLLNDAHNFYLFVESVLRLFPHAKNVNILLPRFMKKVPRIKGNVTFNFMEDKNLFLQEMGGYKIYNVYFWLDEAITESKIKKDQYFYHTNYSIDKDKMGITYITDGVKI